MITLFNNFDDFLKQMKGKTVNVVGLGVSNKPLIEILLRAGAEVIGRDKNPDASVPFDIELKLGDNYLDDLCGDYTFKSPGIRPDLEAFQEFTKKGGVLLSEMEVFFDVCPCKIIGVTGSDGKTTTTTLIFELLKKEGYNVHIGGNIGAPLLPLTESMKKEDICVIELSSFQLMTMKKSPDISVITNITPNHLDYHKDFREYIDAKLNICRYQSSEGIVVLNADDEVTGKNISEIKGEKRYFSLSGNNKNGIYYENEGIYLDGEKILSSGDITIPGMHNVSNFMTAYMAVKDFIKKETYVTVAGEFEGVPHRIEFVAEINGVKYYNDSIASSPSRTISCLDTFMSQGKKIILIAGGKSKKIPYDDLGEHIVKKAQALYLIGHKENPGINTAEDIKKAVLKWDKGFPVFTFDNMEEAVAKAKECAKSGDVVALSPASTSFDKYKNFEIRGNHFKECVRNG